MEKKRRRALFLNIRRMNLEKCYIVKTKRCYYLTRLMQLISNMNSASETLWQYGYIMGR